MIGNACLLTWLLDDSITCLCICFVLEQNWLTRLTQEGQLQWVGTHVYMLLESSGTTSVLFFFY